MVSEVGTAFPQTVRNYIWEKQGGRCVLCHRECRKGVGNKADDAFTVDHIIPKRLGGQGTIENARGLCSKCHRRRNNGEITFDGRPKGLGKRRRS